MSFSPGSRGGRWAPPGHRQNNSPDVTTQANHRRSSSRIHTVLHHTYCARLSYPGASLAPQTQPKYFLARLSNYQLGCGLSPNVYPRSTSRRQTVSVAETDEEAQALPSVYRDLIVAFSKTRASQLPPHRSSDCAIDLLPDAVPPRGRIFPLSQPESRAMNHYIQEELAKGFIRPSTSPASAGFFFVKKKGGDLRPCIDYRGLNEITVKFRYPLPLVPSALEQLRSAQLFTKLDLRCAYNLIRIERVMNGRLHSQLLQGTTNIGSCRSRQQSIRLSVLINDVFRDMLDHYVIVYIDDILVTQKLSKNTSSMSDRYSND